MYSENICKSFGRPVPEDWFLKVSRPGVAKQESYTSPSNLFHGPEIWKSWNFPKYWRWWRVQASKITKFVRWHDFNALRRAHVSCTWLVEWLHPKSNIVYKGNSSTKGGRLIHALSNFDLGFRDDKWCILKIFEDRLVGPCMNFIFPKYHGWTLRNKKRYSPKPPCSWCRILKMMKISKILTLVRGSGF